jgi:putative membrane protein
VDDPAWGIRPVDSAVHPDGRGASHFLGFRNTVSYDRYWEARKQWGALLIGARSLTREIASFAPGEVALQQRVARTLSAFTYALKHQLRGTDPREDLACRLDTAILERVCATRFVRPTCSSALPRTLPPRKRPAWSVICSCSRWIVT